MTPAKMPRQPAPDQSTPLMSINLRTLSNAQIYGITMWLEAQGVPEQHVLINGAGFAYMQNTEAAGEALTAPMH